MERLAMNIIKPLVLFTCFLIVSCATITVNVYFPAEEVRDAYSSEPNSRASEQKYIS